MTSHGGNSLEENRTVTVALAAVIAVMAVWGASSLSVFNDDTSVLGTSRHRTATFAADVPTGWAWVKQDVVLSSSVLNRFRDPDVSAQYVDIRTSSTEIAAGVRAEQLADANGRSVSVPPSYDDSTGNDVWYLIYDEPLTGNELVHLLLRRDGCAVDVIAGGVGNWETAWAIIDGLDDVTCPV